MFIYINKTWIEDITEPVICQKSVKSQATTVNAAGNLLEVDSTQQTMRVSQKFFTECIAKGSRFTFGGLGVDTCSRDPAFGVCNRPCAVFVAEKLPCLWEKPPKRVSFDVSEDVLLSFCVAGVALCAIRLHTVHSTLHTLHPTLYAPHFTHYTPHSTLTLHTPTLHTLHFTLHTLQFTLHTPHSTHHTLHTTLHTPHFTLYTLHFTLYTPHFTLHTYTPHFTLYTPHFTLHTLHFTHYTPHSTLHTSHSTLYTPHTYTPHFTLHTLHSTLYTPHSTLQILHSRLYRPHSTLHTPHTPLSTVHTLHSTLYTPHSTLQILHSRFYTPDFTDHTLHSTLHTLYSPQFTLYTPHFTLHAPHSKLSTPHFALHTPHLHLILLAVTSVSSTWSAFGFVGFSSVFFFLTGDWAAHSTNICHVWIISLNSDRKNSISNHMKSHVCSCRKDTFKETQPWRVNITHQLKISDIKIEAEQIWESNKRYSDT